MNKRLVSVLIFALVVSAAASYILYRVISDAIGRQSESADQPRAGGDPQPGKRGADQGRRREDGGLGRSGSHGSDG